MEEYLYGLGGCVWRGGDNSGDEEDEEAMVMRVGKRELQVLGRVWLGGWGAGAAHFTATNTRQPASAIPVHTTCYNISN